MMVRWICGVSLKDRRGQWRIYEGHWAMWRIGCRSVRNVVVAGVRCVGKGRKTWGE